MVDTFVKQRVLTRTFTAGEDLTAGDLVELGSSAGTVVKASADSQKVVGIVVDARYEGMYRADIDTGAYTFKQGTKVTVLMQGVGYAKAEPDATINVGTWLKAGDGVVTAADTSTDNYATIVGMALEGPNDEGFVKVLLKI